jgi:hypothetical protein
VSCLFSGFIPDAAGFFRLCIYHACLFFLVTNAVPCCSDLDDGSSKTHGTDDVVDFGDDYITAARDLLSTWVNNPDDLAEGALAPYQNAENIAAAATGESLVKLGSLVWSETNTDRISSTQRTGSSSSVDSRKLLWMVRGVFGGSTIRALVWRLSERCFPLHR